MESPFRADVLKGKAALVTGGGSGIGFEIAAQLARHGAQVAIMGRRREVLDKAVAALRSQGLRAVGFDGDVRKQEDAARVLAATVEHFGKLDILVNGAAGNFLASPEDLTPKGFRTGTSTKHALVCIQIRRSYLFQLFAHCQQYTKSSFDQLC